MTRAAGWPYVSSAAMACRSNIAAGFVKAVRRQVIRARPGRSLITASPPGRPRRTIMRLPGNGRVAWVTGAGKGIGRALALALAAEGWRVAVSARTAEDLTAVAADGRPAPSRADLNVTDPAAGRGDRRNRDRHGTDRAGDFERRHPPPNAARRLFGLRFGGSDRRQPDERRPRFGGAVGGADAGARDRGGRVSPAIAVCRGRRPITPVKRR